MIGGIGLVVVIGCGNGLVVVGVFGVIFGGVVGSVFEG